MSRHVDSQGESEVIVGQALEGRRDDVVLTRDVLDRMDEIVPPGVTLNPADNGWVSPALPASARRR